MRVDLAGSVAIIAGDGSGLSAAISASLGANGATVERVSLNDSDALAAAIAKHGRLDILINVALGPDEISVGRIEQLCRAAAGLMTKPGGCIVNVGSAFGVVAVRGESGASATAAAIFSLTRSLALELGGSGIRVNAVAVGARDEVGDERLLSHTPLARAATPDEIAAATLFLVDPENSYTTGHVLVVDGGWTAGYARNF